MSLDDLTDRPLQLDPTLSPNTVAFVRLIDECLDDSRLEYAFPTLEGIRRTVTGTNRVSEGQQRAVENIRASAREKTYTRSRRYEGWS